MKSTKALIIVDLQNDFMPGGALEVKNGDEVVPVANKLMPLFDIVVASRDWHPAQHGSFVSQNVGIKAGERVSLGGIQQIVWPDHCVQNSEGAKLVSSLQQEHITMMLFKGTDPEIHSYSTFFDDAHRNNTGLHKILNEQGVTDLYMLGLATDYCVKFSVLDAIELGFNVHVIVDGCRGIDVTQGDSQRAFDEMKRVGARLINSSDVMEQFS